jgi:hypothetical protein
MLAWEDNGVLLDISFSFVSLIEEEDVIGADTLQLPSHLRDLLTSVSRH